MTCNCQENHNIVQSYCDFLHLGDTGLIITIFLTGLIASFTHCIGMCGPIAMSQVSMRLMHLPQQKMSQIERIKLALIMPYYLGKATSYNIMLIIAFTISSNIGDLMITKLISISFLLLAALIFAYIGIDQALTLPKIRILKTILNKYTNFLSKRLNFYPSGFKGYIAGVALGFIPCGIVYACIALVIASTNNFVVAVIAMIFFGIATFPGLFVISLLGQGFFNKFKPIFKIFYSIIMLLNSYLILDIVFNKIFY